MSFRNFLALSAALAGAGLAPAADAAERTARLVIDVKVTGTEQWRDAKSGDYANVRIQQTWSLTTAVKSDGELVAFNEKAPDYAQKQMANAAHVAQAVQRAQGKNEKMTMEEFQARMQKGQAECKGDQQCLYQLSMKAAEWTTALYASSAPPGKVVEETEADRIFLHYYGFENCGSRFRVTMNDSVEGKYSDVQGQLPFSHTRSADYTGDDTQRKLLCANHNIVVDTREGMLYTDGFLLPGARGKSVHVENGLKQEFEGEMPVKSEALQWVNEQIRKAPLSGTRKATLPVKATHGPGSVPYATLAKGTIQVEMTWRFESL